MNRQQIFDVVKNHLLSQGVRAYGRDKSTGRDIGCWYRMISETGKPLKCAVGVLIPDELYRPEMEGKGIGVLAFSGTSTDGFPDLDHSDYSDLPSFNLPDFFREHCVFLLSLQDIHDNDYPGNWEKSLRAFAANKGLQYNR